MVLVFHAMATNGSRFSHSAPLHVDLDGRAELPLERHKRCALRVLLPTSILSPLHTWHKRLLKAERLYCGIELRLKDLVDLHIVAYGRIWHAQSTRTCNYRRKGATIVAFARLCVCNGSRKFLAYAQRFFKRLAANLQLIYGMTVAHI